MSAVHGYVGRFAPSPTGPLHLGSLVAAIGSWLDARHAGGRWLLRIDDLDTARNAPGATEAIVGELSRLGLEWDGAPLRQSADRAPYRDALAALRASGRAFACACSRRDLVAGVYPGTCRAGVPPGRRARSLRLRVDDDPVRIIDAVQGPFEQDLRRDVGDFVIHRADGVVAYHLATVVDDARAGVSHVVRGADLLASTPRQVALQRALGLGTPCYAHLPVVVDARGHKLSKQTHAPDTRAADPGALWHDALTLLGHRPPPALRGAGAPALRDWALEAWSLARVARARADAARPRTAVAAT